MPQRETGENLNEIEIILIRQLASTLTTPLMIFDPHGTLLFYNEPAEPILGRRFEETGRIVVGELHDIFYATDEQGKRLPPEAMPSHIVLAECRPASNRFWMRGLDGVRHYLEVSAFPLVGRGMRLLGAVSVFWESDGEPAPPACSTTGLTSAVEFLLEGH